MTLSLRSKLGFVVVVFLATCFFITPIYRQQRRAPSASAALAVALAQPPVLEIPAAPRPAISPVKAVLEKLVVWKAETDPLRRAAFQAELLALLTDANAEGIVRSLTPELLDTPIGEIALKRWASLDHFAAATWLALLPGGASELQAGLVTYGWLAQAREQLHAYVDGLPPGPWREQVLTAATNDALLLKAGPEAIGLLQRLPPATQRNEMLGWASTQWAMQNPTEAAAWVQQVNDPVLQLKLFGAVAVGYAWSDPAKAADLLRSSGVAESSDLTAVVSVMNIWGTKNPAQAAQWAVDSLDGVARTQAIRCAVTAWGYQDLPAALRWIEGLPAGADRTQAERTYAKIAAAHEGREIGD